MIAKNAKKLPKFGHFLEYASVFDVFGPEKSFGSIFKCHHVKERKKMKILGMFVFFPRFLKVEYD